MMIKFLISFFLICLGNQSLAIAQENSLVDNPCPPKTVFELFKKKDSILIVKPIKNSFLLVIPVIGVQPATGFSYGATGQYTFKGKEISDKYSSANLGVTFTTKKQLLINAKNNILLKNNRIYLRGDYRLYIFTQPNYGLGTNIVPANREDPDFDIESIKEPMDYNYFKFHQTASWEIKKNFYIGGGVELDWYSTINDKNLDVENGRLTNHYNYSVLNGFNENEYFVNGLSFNFIYYSRDNQINTRKGWFSNVDYRFGGCLMTKK